VKLAEITIPQGVTSIGERAFYGCEGLTSLVIPESVRQIEKNAFERCGGLASLTLSEGVTSIGERAFAECTSLASLHIPATLTSVNTEGAESSFLSCPGLASITVAEGNAVYHSAGNCLIETESKTLVLGCKNSVIPRGGSVTELGSYAFYGCRDLTSINIPADVAFIGDRVFYGCKNLTAIHFNWYIVHWDDSFKLTHWDEGTGDYTIYCVDGTIEKKSQNK
jgi:hypothetical protein